MDFAHEPVLMGEAISGLRLFSKGVYVDATVGGAGHAREICMGLEEEGVFIGIDRDAFALETARARLTDFVCRRFYISGNFENIDTVLADIGISGIDGALLDIGVSSHQLDNPKRGFSYMEDGPLDMRMAGADTDSVAEDGQVLTAKKVVNCYSEKDLTEIIYKYGEERWAKRIAEFIVRQRREKELKTTFDLVETIKKAVPKGARRDGPHPAKRTFQAIRIEVNDELGSLKRAIEKYIDALNSGGRLAIITFHSLEDRIVKEEFNNRLNPCICGERAPICVCGRKTDVRLVNKKPIMAGEVELERNHRSRSAKLRIIEKV